MKIRIAACAARRKWRWQHGVFHSVPQVNALFLLWLHSNIEFYEVNLVKMEHFFMILFFDLCFVQFVSSSLVVQYLCMLLFNFFLQYETISDLIRESDVKNSKEKCYANLLRAYQEILSYHSGKFSSYCWKNLTWQFQNYIFHCNFLWHFVVSKLLTKIPTKVEYLFDFLW